MLIQDPPVADFDVLGACLRDTTVFNNNTSSGCDSMSVNQNDSILKFYWDFGDCSDTIIEEISWPFFSPSHIYSSPGVYMVTLKVPSFCATTYDTNWGQQIVLK